MKTIFTTKQNRTKILQWIGTIGAFVLLVLLLKNQGWTEIYKAFQEVSLSRFILCIILIFISRFAVVGRWYVLLSAVTDFSFWQSLRITFAGLFASNFLPTTVGGDVVRFAGVIQLKFDNVISAASLIVDRLVGMFGMALVLPFGTRQLITWFAYDQKEYIYLWGSTLFSQASKYWEKGSNFLKKIYHDVMLWSKHPKSILISFILTGIHMLCFFSIIYLLLDDLGENLNLGIVAGLWSFVYFVTLLPISINGYGIQEISIALIFSEVGGVSLQNGLTVSILFRTLMLFGSLPGAVFIPNIITGLKTSE